MISAAAVLAAAIAASDTAPSVLPKGAVVHTAADLASAVYDRAENGRGFAMTGLVVHASPIHDGMRYHVSDSSGATIVETKDFARFSSNPVPGDMLEASGFIDIGKESRREYAHCTNINVIAHGTPPKPIETTIAELLAGGHDFQLVTTRAKVRDVVHDEIDPRFAFIVIGSEGSSIPLVLEQIDLYTLFGDSDPMGAELEVTGVCIASPLTDRRQFGRLLTPSGPNSVRICEHAAADPFDTPVLADFRRLQPAQIAALGRHRVTGRVLAVEKRRLLVIRTTDGRIHNVTLASGDPPRCGSLITAVGFPSSDLYRINLVRAKWRFEDETVAPPDPCVPDSPSRIFHDSAGRGRFDATYHGRAVRFSGIVRGLRFAGDETTLKVECDGHLVNVDASSCPETLESLEAGCLIEIGGACVMESEAWSPDTVFPRVVGFTLVLRTPDDIRITARPPWWTTSRLLVAVGVLLAIIAAVLVWNILLRRISERRGKQLAQEQVARVESDLKIYERTRLAVELHDALSQTLTGISFAIDAAVRLVSSDADGAKKRLVTASHTLDSCRRELKNCLWDLRSNALEEPDMNAAIRRTLTPHVADDVLSVRFNVPRERFSDASAHAILCIIRELVINALRHGDATRVWIAGNVEDGMFRFSVKDNGRGFSSTSAPGASEGHYGLLGIRERVDAFGGTFTLESRPGQGCKATVSLKVPGDEGIDDHHDADHTETA